MRFRFLGGAGEIGRLGIVIEERGRRMLVDYGLAPDTPPGFPLQAPEIDAMLLTHAHLDHSGMVPELSLRGSPPVWTSEITRRVANILHHDSLKIARIEGYPEPFPEVAIEQTEAMWRLIDPVDPFTVGDEGDGVTVTPHLAGHIPGAYQFLIEGDKRLVVTGDLFTDATRLVPAAKPVPADVLFIETTYAGREHPDRDAEERRLAEAVDETIARGGTALVPAFATGRTQEVLLALSAHTDHEIWLDGMGSRVLDIFLDNPAFLADPSALREVKRRVRRVRTQRHRVQAIRSGGVIVTTSGMLEGGPVLYYLSKVRRDPDSSVLLTGYQVEGTNGRRLLDERKVHDRGVDLDVHCRIDKFDLSTHLGHSAIVDYVAESGCDDVVLYHGYGREKLVDDLSAHARVHLPDRGETVTV